MPNEYEVRSDLPVPMKRADKLLYHQIHPFKLFVDFATSFWSSWLLWEQRWTLAALVAFAPSIFVSLLLVGFADLEWLQSTPLGRYVAYAMNRKIEALRSAGQIIMWCGAGFHLPWLLPLGLFVVLLAWANGLWTVNVAHAPRTQGSCARRSA